MLKGIRIVEIEGLGPTPFAGMMFSDLGAEVTVIHRKDKSIFTNPMLACRLHPEFGPAHGQNLCRLW